MQRVLFLLLAILILSSHDLYLKLDEYFLSPGQTAHLSLYNGTFENSENLITRDRMVDASIVSAGIRKAIDAGQWKDQDSTITHVSFDVSSAGTYVAGVSTKARNIELDAEAFNHYLEHDGVLDMLESRKKYGQYDQDAVESYEKHVKAIYQVGDERSNDWNTPLGYPIEFIPKSNPYAAHTGENLVFQLLLEGAPLSNQLVYAHHVPTDHSHSHNHSHDHANDHHHDDHDHDTSDTHTHTSGQQLRTDINGLVTVELPADGKYYIRTIYMTEADDSDQLTHRSKWATLTFGVTHDHEDSDHSHADVGIPSWVYIVGSMLIIIILFFAFQKKG